MPRPQQRTSRRDEFDAMMRAVELRALTGEDERDERQLALYESRTMLMEERERAKAQAELRDNIDAVEALRYLTAAPDYDDLESRAFDDEWVGRYGHLIDKDQGVRGMWDNRMKRREAMDGLIDNYRQATGKRPADALVLGPDGKRRWNTHQMGREILDAQTQLSEVVQGGKPGVQVTTSIGDGWDVSRSVRGSDSRTAEMMLQFSLERARASDLDPDAKTRYLSDADNWYKILAERSGFGAPTPAANPTGFANSGQGGAIVKEKK